MKTLIIFLFILGAHLTFGQEYTDTIYYKTGMVRSGQIFKETKNSIKYNYLGKNGRIITTTARKSMLNKFTVGDENSSVASNFVSDKQSLVNSGRSEEELKSERRAVAGVGVGFLIVIIAVPVTIFVGIMAILNAF